MTSPSRSPETYAGVPGFTRSTRTPDLTPTARPSPSVMVSTLAPATPSEDTHTDVAITGGMAIATGARPGGAGVRGISSGVKTRTAGAGISAAAGIGAMGDMRVT